MLTGRGDPAELSAAMVSRDFFRVMPVAPLVGRLFAPDGFAGTDAPDVIVLGEALWRSRFGGDSSIVGKNVMVNGTPRTVLGVVAASASWPRPAGPRL